MLRIKESACRRTFKDEDGYYFNLGEGEWECPNCGKISDFTTHVDIYYNVTKKVNECADRLSYKNKGS